MDKKSNYLLFAGIILIIVVSPTLFNLPAIFKFWDFSQSGQIGGTIGGITSPFINLLGAVLVYLSFKQQINANKIQNKALENEIQRNNAERKYASIIYDIDNLRADINDFRLFGENALFGTNALYKFQQNVISMKSLVGIEQITGSHPFKNLYYLIASTDNILSTIKKLEIDEEEKRGLYQKLIYLYSSKIGEHALIILTKINEFKVDNNMVEVITLTEIKLRSFITLEKL